MPRISIAVSEEEHKYYQTIESIRANPNNEVYKNQLQITGQKVIDDLNNLYDGIEEQEATFQKSLTEDVGQINSKLEQIQKINLKIKQLFFQKRTVKLVTM